MNQPVISNVTRLAPKIEEQRLLEIAQTINGERIVCMSTGRAQAAERLALDRPSTEVTVWYIDGYATDLAIKHLTQPKAEPSSQASSFENTVGSIQQSEASAYGSGEGGERRMPENLRVVCAPEWPTATIDLALVPLSSRGEAELTRDSIQSAYHSLEVGGHLVTSVDNAKDRWLHELLKSYEKSVKVRPFKDAMVYIIQKTGPLKKLKDFSCELSFMDCDSQIRFVTRPGVFSHRELDSGARQLLDAVDVFPDSKLLDIGCGSGTVALGLAARDPSATIHAIDSNSRAIWCTQQGVKLNGFENVVVAQNHSGLYGDESSFDMVITNPPYFADFRIAQHFLETGRRALRPDGRIVVVTKQPRWYEENMPSMFDAVEIYESRRYFIASGLKTE